MLDIGEIVTGRDIGQKASNNYHKYIWHACVICGKERWVALRKGQPGKKLCWLCAMANRRGAKHHNWKGGCRHSSEGYIEIKLNPEDFFYPMAGCEGYTMEHRMVMARHLGRLLHPWEVVHHKDGNRSNNQIENLELTTRGSHILAHNKGYRDGFLNGYTSGKDARIKALQAEIHRLKDGEYALV